MRERLVMAGTSMVPVRPERKRPAGEVGSGRNCYAVQAAAILARIASSGIRPAPARALPAIWSGLPVPGMPMHKAPRCGARTRRQSPCQSPAMPNGRCRMHGGKSPGAPKGNKNALKHGRYTVDAIARRRSIATLTRIARELA